MLVDDIVRWSDGPVAVLESKVVRLERRGVKRATVIAAMPTTKARVLKLEDVEEVVCVLADDGVDMQKMSLERKSYIA